LGTFFRDDNKVNHAPDKETRTQALKGIRILDLSMWWSGPRATRLLAEAGAEVFKIESPYYPDPWRVAGLAQAEQKGILDRFKPEDRINVSPNFNIENTNKFSLTLDLTLDRGKEILLKLAETCDIVVENYSPRVMKNFGLSYETFQNVNHDIILVSMPAFGLSGPDLNHVAFGATLEAMMGITYITGYRNEDPMCLSGTAYTDPICGINTALAMLMALRYRNLTGEGLHVEVAQLESVMPFVSPMIMDYTMNGHIQERIGNQHAWKAPHGCYRCKGNDAWITISIATEEEWKQFCQAIKRPELATQDRFSERRKRWQNQDELNALIEAWTLSLEPYEAMKLLQSYGIASGPVLNAKQLVKDPQRLSNIRNMGFYRANRHPVTGVPCEFISHPRLSETAVGIERPAPCFGEHNKYILEKMLHFTEQDIKKLREEKVISDVLLVD
jgi:crotonobetainyl-CoA:carnitine CoA-transferase CaiB-like acyl-CoA transferase